MKKYLPNNSELRIAIFTALTTILIFALGHILVRGVWSGMHKGMNCMGGEKCSMMEKMGRGGGMMGGDMKNMDHSGDMMDMTMNDMVTMLEGKSGKDLEKEFIIGMIPHHQGAVEMSKKLLEDKTISPEMKKFAEDIIRAQEGEIKMMNEWLQKY